jgi:hypothetical protein
MICETPGGGVGAVYAGTVTVLIHEDDGAVA